MLGLCACVGVSLVNVMSVKRVARVRKLSTYHCCPSGPSQLMGKVCLRYNKTKLMSNLLAIPSTPGTGLGVQFDFHTDLGSTW